MSSHGHGAANGLNRGNDSQHTEVSSSPIYMKSWSEPDSAIRARCYTRQPRNCWRRTDETFPLGVIADEILRDVSCRRFDVLIREFRPFFFEGHRADKRGSMNSMVLLAHRSIAFPISSEVKAFGKDRKGGWSA